MCGRTCRNTSGEVGVRLSDGRVGFAGLVTCGSVWACPVCSAKIMARRALEIGSAVAAAQAQGLGVAFCTLTMRHRKGQRLAHLWDGLAHAWGRVTSGKHWIAERQAAGLVGYVRVVETTIGKNGWHVHVHALLFGSELTSSSALDAVMEPMWRRWSAGLQSQGLDAPLPVGSEWHLVTDDLDGTALGDYLAKGAGAAGAIGMELTQTQSKVARSVHSTDSVWSLLRDGLVNGEVGPSKLWHEWEQASKGRRQIAWSRGLRELLGLVVDEQSDEEIAAEELGSVDDTAVWITRHGWARLVAQPALIPDVLTVVEADGADGLSDWLWRHGIDHRKV